MQKALSGISSVQFIIYIQEKKKNTQVVENQHFVRFLRGVLLDSYKPYPQQIYTLQAPGFRLSIQPLNTAKKNINARYEPKNILKKIRLKPWHNETGYQYNVKISE